MSNIYENFEDAKKAYDKHLENHITNVKKAYHWLSEKSIIQENRNLEEQINNHDQSKYSEEEYEPYIKYFNMKQTADVKKEFDYAWLHHIHNNPHHWQYWLLQNDEDGLAVLDMPYEYIVEMICDWYSFSITANKPYEILNWYNNMKGKMKLSVNTRKTVEGYLQAIRNVLDKENKSN